MLKKWSVSVAGCRDESAGGGGGGWEVGASKAGILFLQRGVNRVRNTTPNGMTGFPPPPPTNSSPVFIWCVKKKQKKQVSSSKTGSPGSTDRQGGFTQRHCREQLCYAFVCMCSCKDILIFWKDIALNPLECTGECYLVLLCRWLKPEPSSAI